MWHESKFRSQDGSKCFELMNWKKWSSHLLRREKLKEKFWVNTKSLVCPCQVKMPVKHLCQDQFIASQLQYMLCDKPQNFFKHVSFKVSTMICFLSRGCQRDIAGGFSSCHFGWRLGIGDVGLRTFRGAAPALG